MMIDCNENSEMDNSLDINEMGDISDMNDFMDSELMFDDTEDKFENSKDNNMDVRRRLEKYLDDARLKRELDY